MNASIRVGKQTRFFILWVALIIWIGILLTGIREVHWFLYIPAGWLPIAALTGICPGMFLARLVFKTQ